MSWCIRHLIVGYKLNILILSCLLHIEPELLWSMDFSHLFHILYSSYKGNIYERIVIPKRLYSFLVLNDVCFTNSNKDFDPKHSKSNDITELSNDIIA